MSAICHRYSSIIGVLSSLMGGVPEKNAGEISLYPNTAPLSSKKKLEK
jgi:hypothetical protein